MDYDEDMLPEWVIRNLRKFGNCSINKSIIEKFGIDRVKDFLTKYGFSCNVNIYKKTFTEQDYNGKLIDEEKEFCILTVV